MANRMTLEEQGRTVADATQAVLTRLNLRRDEVTIEVLDEGSTGFMNLVKARPAVIRVSYDAPAAPPTAPQVAAPLPIPADETPAPAGKRPRATDTDDDFEPDYVPATFDEAEAHEETPADADEVRDAALVYLRGIIGNMGVESVEVQVAIKGRSMEFAITAETEADTGLIIGREGETLLALQHLVSKFMNRGRKDKFYLFLDTEGYRARRITMLRKKADRLADKTKHSGRSEWTDMLNPHDRRIIHMRLSENSDVTTESHGEGYYKKVEIKSTRPRPQSRRGDRADRGDRPFREGRPDRGPRGERGDRGDRPFRQDRPGERSGERRDFGGGRRGPGAGVGNRSDRPFRDPNREMPHDPNRDTTRDPNRDSGPTPQPNNYNQQFPSDSLGDRYDYGAQQRRGNSDSGDRGKGGLGSRRRRR